MLSGVATRAIAVELTVAPPKYTSPYGVAQRFVTENRSPGSWYFSTLPVQSLRLTNTTRIIIDCLVCCGAATASPRAGSGMT